MKRAHTFLILLLPCLAIAQQPSQADLDKMLKEAQQKANAVMNDPKYKKYTGNNSAVNAAGMMNIPSNPFSLEKPDTAFLSRMKTPEKNLKALASIPVKPMSKADLKIFLADMPSQADLEKLQKDMQQKANDIMNDPKYKKYVGNNNAGNTGGMMNIPPTRFLFKSRIPPFFPK